MYRECTSCKRENILTQNNNESTFYEQWKTITEDRIGAKNIKYHVKITKKVNVDSTVSDMVKELNLQKCC